LHSQALRDTLLKKYLDKIKRKLSRRQFEEMMSSASLVDLDRAFFAAYNDFESLGHYYAEMCVLSRLTVVVE
jgi:hypothetical protein